MEKLVIIINGTGGSGKDTLCNLAGQYYNVEIVSAITPIKMIAEFCGWDGKKDKKSRKFLSDLKNTFISYNDLPTKYLYMQYENFLKSDNDILFVHIREKDEIEKFKKLIIGRCVTLLINRKSANIEKWENTSDDDVQDYNYDCYFDNDGPLSEVGPKFISFIKSLENI